MGEIVNLDTLRGHITERTANQTNGVEIFSGDPHLKPLSLANLRVLSFEWLVDMHLANIQAGELFVLSHFGPDVLCHGDGHVTVQARRCESDTITLVVAEDRPESGVCDARPDGEGCGCVGGVCFRDDVLARCRYIVFACVWALHVCKWWSDVLESRVKSVCVVSDDLCWKQV